MSENGTTTTSEATLNSEDVAAFLRANPDFFAHHSTLLSELKIPHPSGRAISLVERQVDILRERNMDMRRRLSELLAAARDNDDLFSKTRALTLALLEAEDLGQLNEVLATHVLVEFAADFLACHIQGSAPDNVPVDHIFFHSTEFPFANYVHGSQPSCVSLREAELTALFPMAKPDAPGSAIVLPFDCAGQHCVLTIGSRNSAHFSPGMDTLFMSYITDVLNKVLAPCLRR